MHPELRARFNADFTPAKYDALINCLNTTEYWPSHFRTAESPIFLTREFTEEIVTAANEIVDLTRTAAFAHHAADAIPDGLSVPNETAHPNFIAVDFGVCSHERRLVPRLIELQGFPSLYGFQFLLLDCMRRAYPSIPADWTSAFGGIRDDDYLGILRRAVFGNCDPENVILLEIEPEKQNTRIDFASTERLLGIKPVCVTKIKRRARRLFYHRDGREVRIDRIFNRVIFDELLRRRDLQLDFSFQDDLEVQWAGHPNWYFRISKHSLPFLNTNHTSPAYFADEFPRIQSLEEFVLKPLYSFAGAGVDLSPTEQKLAALEKPHEWILQTKVSYADFVAAPDGNKSKAEIRMLYVWPDNEAPVLVNNLVRMSQGPMMGVKFNKNKTWVGSSIALRERE